MRESPSPLQGFYQLLSLLSVASMSLRGTHTLWHTQLLSCQAVGIPRMRVVYLCLSWSNVKTALPPAPQLKKTLSVTWGNNQVSSWEGLEIHLDFIQVVNWLKKKILEVTWVRSGSGAGEDIGCGQPQQQQYKLLNTHLLSILWDKQELGLAARHRHGHVAVAETSVTVCVLSQP